MNCKKESKRGCNNKSSKCITHNLWDQLDQHINSFFEKVKLQDLVKNQINCEEYEEITPKGFVRPVKTYKVIDFKNKKTPCIRSFFQEERVYIYFDNSFAGERVGFLLDFFIYSSIPLLLFPFISKEIIDKHGNLLVYYLLLNALYFLLNFIPFSSRIANLSWCVIPIFMAVFVTSSPFYRRYSKLGDLLLIFLAIPAFKYNYWLLS